MQHAPSPCLIRSKIKAALETDRVGREWATLARALFLMSDETYKGACLGQNSMKNRYRDVLPNASSRVRLGMSVNWPGGPGPERCAPPTDSASDYINANYIRGTTEHAYIACQAPVPDAFVDFWQMLWENKVAVVVMLTRLVERTFLKAHQYWPDEDERTRRFGPFAVTFCRTSHHRSIAVRVFSVRHTASGDPPRQLVQLHYTDWPDFGVPHDPSGIVRVLELMDLYSAMSKNHPIVIHCSAGIGRTGTLITIHLYMERLKRREHASVAKIVALLRRQRMGMVQTKEQYAFIYQVLLRLLATSLHTPSHYPRPRPCLTVRHCVETEQRRSSRHMRKLSEVMCGIPSQVQRIAETAKGNLHSTDLHFPSHTDFYRYYCPNASRSALTRTSLGICRPEKERTQAPRQRHLCPVSPAVLDMVVASNIEQSVRGLLTGRPPASMPARVLWLLEGARGAKGQLITPPVDPARQPVDPFGCGGGDSPGGTDVCPTPVGDSPRGYDDELDLDGLQRSLDGYSSEEEEVTDVLECPALLSDSEEEPDCGLEVYGHDLPLVCAPLFRRSFSDSALLAWHTPAVQTTTHTHGPAWPIMQTAHGSVASDPACSTGGRQS